MRKLLLALAFLPFLSATASAQNYFVVTIVNETPDTITFTAGAPGAQQAYTLLPFGQSVSLAEAACGFAPVMTITWEPIVNRPSPPITQALQAYPSPTPSGGKVYAFQANPGDRLVGLVPKN